MKLNLGCGHVKMDGYVNIDCNPNLKPDLIHDITRPLPYENETIEDVWLIHVLEHLPKKHHFDLFREVNRVLKPGGLFVLAYPEWTKCASNYLLNVKGMKDFWENTLYGRQSTPSDFHVCIVDTSILTPLLVNMGFEVEASPQEDAPYYTIMRCTKFRNIITKEDVIRQEVFQWG